MTQYRLTVEDVMEGHRQAIVLSRRLNKPGTLGVRDISLIESAVARPYSGYYETVWEKAAVILHGISKNHGFVDGNKRAAAQAMLLFLVRSGYGLFGPQPTEADQTEFERVIIAVVDNQMSLEELIVWVRERIIPLAPSPIILES